MEQGLVSFRFGFLGKATADEHRVLEAKVQTDFFVYFEPQEEATSKISL